MKKVAKQLLGRLKDLLVLDWRKRPSARARVEDAIKDMLDTGLPRAYSTDLYKQTAPSFSPVARILWPVDRSATRAGLFKRVFCRIP